MTTPGRSPPVDVFVLEMLRRNPIPRREPKRFREGQMAAWRLLIRQRLGLPPGQEVDPPEIKWYLSEPLRNAALRPKRLVT